jgi:hypothetical protein
VLAKTSGADYATGWTTPSAGGGGGASSVPAVTAPSGYWGATPVGGSTSMSGVTADTMYAHPMRVARNVSVTAMAYQCTTGGTSGSAVHLGIYADNGSGLPGALIAECATTGLGQNVGMQVLSFASSVPLTAGTTYWLAYVNNTGATSTQAVVSCSNPNQDANFAHYGNAGAPGTAQNAVLASGTTGALPATFTPTGYAALHPFLYYKVA